MPAIDSELGKEGRGAVLVIRGSAEIPGAPILSGLAALRAGAGKLQIATARTVALAAAVSVLEARVVGLPETRKGELAQGCEARLVHEIAACSALLVGPGMRSDSAALGLIQHCFQRKTRPPLIVDAGGLCVFKGAKALRASPSEVVITPHAGEMANLCGRTREQVLAEPLTIAREVASSLQVVVTLKGAETFIVAPDGTAYSNTAGNVGLGTSGSGDVLSGVIAGLCARGASALQAAAWGVYLHAKAGELLARQRGTLGFLARELLDPIPALLAKLSRAQPPKKRVR